MSHSEHREIPVTVPFLPPLDEYRAQLEEAWKSGILTHNGPLVQRLERELCSYLQTKNIVAVTNGTIAIQLAIRALGLRGEIITTPFTWIATSSAIVWEGCTPVFVDVDPKTFNLDPSKIEERITKNTAAILPVHVFSRPCAIEDIDAIARAHGLKVIYDAAHAMAVSYHGRSIFEYGDIAAGSFHATKLFNSGEGGACMSQDQSLFERLKRLRFFGHNDAKEVVDDGCNGKMTEVHAALGLVNLRHLDSVRRNRRHKYNLYQKLLNADLGIEYQDFHPEEYNYSYLPVVFRDESKVLKVFSGLREHNIIARRYFWPALNTMRHVFPYVRQPVAENLASRILCLPLYDALPDEEIERIAGIVNESLEG